MIRSRRTGFAVTARTGLLLALLAATALPANACKTSAA